MKKYVLLFFILVSYLSNAAKELPENKYSHIFEKTYQEYPQVPVGILEAIAFTNTRFQHLEPSEIEESCTGIPFSYGILGLTLDGKNYFRNNLLKIAELSNVSTDEIISSPEASIKAFAKAYTKILSELNLRSTRIEDQIQVLIELSEIPLENKQNNFALNSQIYSFLSFLNEVHYQQFYNLPQRNINLVEVFGEENLIVLSSAEVKITDSEISDSKGNKFSGTNIRSLLSTDYTPALWNPTTCNFSSRNGTAISGVTIHTVQGSYAGCISWFKNCSASASAHYVIRSSDGQVTQMVLEKDKAWHVGSANPYTIGIEHEGYVNNAAWYTTAMYNSSADLCKDICNSGYNINPLRTYSGPGCSGTTQQCEQGSCIKIKGHQMFPDQTHSDPGPNWDWARFYRLINDNPAVTTQTGCSGTYNDPGGASGAYANDQRNITIISPAGATSVTLTFTSFNTEANYDYLYIYNGNTTTAPLIGKFSGTTSPGTITANSGSILLEFRSDCATTANGWTANWSCNTGTVAPTSLQVTAPTCSNSNATFNWSNSGNNWSIEVSANSGFTNSSTKSISTLTTTTGPSGFSPAFAFQSNTTYYWRIYNGVTYTNGPNFITANCDITAPTTIMTTSGNWQTTNFDVTFNDADNSGGSGVNQRFYQVLDYNGTEWRANGTKGFFNDNFASAIHSDWTIPASSGTWSINSGRLNQSDETAGNSNIYTTITQTSSYKYLYHWSSSMSGTGTNRRSGLHFFIDDPTLPNRNNSYLVWFRVDQSKMEIYKVTNDVLNVVKSTTLTMNAGQWYDYKVSYDPSTGLIEVYRDDLFIDNYIDSSPLTTGAYVSLRNGNSTILFDDVKVYRSRSTTATVTVGNSSAEVRYQNPNPATSSARIKSIVFDTAKNISTPGTLNVNVDWTIPTLSNVNDGSGTDIDSTYNNTQLTANWSLGTDVHSGILNYLYAIGTTSGATNLVNWTSIGSATSVTKTGLSLTYGQTYYFTIKVENGAGLTSAIINSDGQKVIQTPPSDNVAPTTSIIPPLNWQTQDFSVTFNDVDNVGGSGISGSYYQVLDYNNSEWRANGTKGFFNDNFNANIHADWTIAASSGTWNINSGNLNQTDEAVSNSNIYASITQTSSYKYLYHWKSNMSGTGTNRRSGLHFFIDDPTKPNRNNSYLVWFRVDQGKLEFYRNTNDVLGIVKTTNVTVNANQMYDYKVTYDPSSGLIEVYRDNIFIDSYIDPSPLTSGDYISLRNGNSTILFDDVKVYRSRNTSENVSIGNSTADVRYQNANPSSPACQINSITKDVAGNISAIASQTVDVDWTSPNTITSIYDGAASDIDTITIATELKANWVNSSDTHSNLNSYWYCVGTAAGDSNVVDWTNNATSTNITHTGLNLINGETYYFSVKAVNGAGLHGTPTVSNGQTLFLPPVALFESSDSVICAGYPISFINNSLYASDYEWIFDGGFPETSNAFDPIVTFSTGVHTVKLIAHGPGGTDTLIASSLIDVKPFPLASISTQDTSLFLANANASFTNNSSNASAYWWDFGDGNTSTATNPSHQYTAEGTYSVTLVAINGFCANDTLIMNNYIEVIDPTGISEQAYNSLRVSPNPFNHQMVLHYQLMKEQVIQIRILDVLGKEIAVLINQQQSEGEKQLTIDADKLNLSKGMYLIEFKNGEEKTQIIRINKL